jgi:hypothetical protein
MRLLKILFLLPILSLAQTISTLSSLSNEIAESSGLLYLNNQIITHNDSGGEAALYEIDSLTGTVVRKVIIENAINTDWEDICADETSIYIGDVGNNTGNRTDLKIYKININDYFNNDTVVAEIIHFEYADQSNYSNQLFTTNYDAEALIVLDDSLYLFSKNWANSNCTIYALPKDSGSYQISAIDTLENTGLITGASLNSFSNKLILTSYALINAAIIEVFNFHSGIFSNGTINKYTINTSASHQIEGVCTLSEFEYLLSAENNSSGEASLYKLTTNEVSINKTSNAYSIYPNPCNKELYINNSTNLQFDIYTITGKHLLRSFNSPINTSELTSGVYILKWTEKEKLKSHSYRICVN